MGHGTYEQLLAQAESGPLRTTAHRVVESQSVISTRKLVDDDEEQAVLEALVDAVKPTLPTDLSRLHYLLSTPFRHPPLRHGSRFGARDERGLFYASLALRTALAEVAYYRFLFLAHSAASLAPLTTELTAFSVGVEARRAVDLRTPPFAPLEDGLLDVGSYAVTQPLGRAMRAAGVEAFVFTSCRDPRRGANLGLFEPAFGRARPSGFRALACYLEADRVTFVPRDPRASTRTAFRRADFEVDGVLPDAGA